MTRMIRSLMGVAALALAFAFTTPAAACPKAGASAEKKATPASCGASAVTFAMADESTAPSSDCPYLAQKKRGCGATDDAVFAATETSGCGGGCGGCAAKAATWADMDDDGAREAAHAFVLRVIALFRLDGVVIAGTDATPPQVAAR